MQGEYAEALIGLKTVMQLEKSRQLLTYADIDCNHAGIASARNTAGGAVDGSGAGPPQDELQQVLRSQLLARVENRRLTHS